MGTANTLLRTLAVFGVVFFSLSYGVTGGTEKDEYSLQAASTRFSGTIFPATARGERKLPLNVQIKVWTLDPSSKHRKFALPLSGFYVANCISGRITTTINNISEKRSPGEFWIVPQGTSMLVQLEGQNASLQTIVFEVTH
jgi:quercetin dioxygenase-like cupin family protein